jgi:hypothetical protein
MVLIRDVVSPGLARTLSLDVTVPVPDVTEIWIPFPRGHDVAVPVTLDGDEFASVFGV